MSPCGRMLDYYEGQRDLAERLRSETGTVSDRILAERVIEPEAGRMFRPVVSPDR